MKDYSYWTVWDGIVRIDDFGRCGPSQQVVAEEVDATCWAQLGRPGIPSLGVSLKCFFLIKKISVIGRGDNKHK